MALPRSVGGIVWRGGLHALSLLALAALAWRARSVLQLAALGAVLAAAASVPVTALERRGWRRGLAVAVVLGGAATAVAALLATIVPLVVRQVRDLASSLPSMLGRARGSAAFAWVEARFDVAGRLSSALDQYGSVVADAAIGAVSGVVNAITGVIVVFALSAFLLGSGPGLWSAALDWAHPARRARLEKLGTSVRRAVAGYVAGALVMAVLGGSVTAVATLLLGVPYWLPLAVATALLGIIPFVGAIVSGALVVLTTFLTSGRTAGVVALVVFVAYQQLEGTMLQPLVQRRTVKLNGLVVLLAILVGMGAGGIFGAVLALPVVAGAKVVAADLVEQRHTRWRRRALQRGGAEETPPGPSAH